MILVRRTPFTPFVAEPAWLVFAYVNADWQIRDYEWLNLGARRVEIDWLSFAHAHELVGHSISRADATLAHRWYTSL